MNTGDAVSPLSAMPKHSTGDPQSSAEAAYEKAVTAYDKGKYPLLAHIIMLRA